MNKIDLVIPMVFPQDPAWQAAYNKAMGGGGAERNVRYRSWDTEELLVKCCLKYMPWLRCIHLLIASESQVQPWMELMVNGSGLKIKDDNHKSLIVNHEPQVRLVFHEQFMPVEARPCFSSPCIEMFLHRIPDLSEYFIYANDDMFPLSPLEESDFFRPSGEAPGTPAGANGQRSMLNVQRSILNPQCPMLNVQCLLPCQQLYERPYPTSPNLFHKACQGGLNMVAKPFGKHYTKTFLRNGHSFAPFLKSSCEEVWRRHGCEIMEHLCPTKRRADSYNQYLYVYYQHLAGLSVNYAPRRQYVKADKPIDQLVQIVRDPNVGIVCLNDNECIRDWETRAEIVRREISAKLNVEHGTMRITTKSDVNARKCSQSPHEETFNPQLSMLNPQRSILNVLIIHYNTPELTAATIQSLWKHTPNARVTIFDNSDKRPFTMLNPQCSMLNPQCSMLNVIDNTRGQIVDWDKWLEQFPDREMSDMRGSKFGSAKHCYSVELCMDRFPNGFVLMDSDVLIKQDIKPLADNGYAWVGQADIKKTRYGVRLPRVIPFLCWINTKMLKAHGIHYFDRQKMYALSMRKPDMGYDTGCWFHEAVATAQLPTREVTLGDYMIHFGHGSWKTKDGTAWLKEHKELWRPTPNPSLYGGGKYTVLTCIFGDYEKVHEVVEKDPNADYILVTDNPSLRSRTWRVVLDPMDGMTPFEKVCEVRYNLWRYAETELVVRLDGSIGINRSLRPIIEKMEYGGYDRCLMIHPRRNTMPSEYAAWVRGRGYSQRQADRCLDYMRRAGYPMDYRGLFQTCFEVVRRGALNDDVNSRTLRLLRELAEDGRMERVDQTILSFVLNRYYADRINVLPVPQRIVTDGRLMMWYLHNSDRPNPTQERIAPMMFNRPVPLNIER